MARAPILPPPSASRGSFDTQFAGRSRVAQVAATESYSFVNLLGEHSGAALTYGAGVNAKVFGAMAVILGAAIMVGGEPISGISIAYKGILAFMSGNGMKAAAMTYGETIDKGAAGHQESGTKIVERFRDNYKAGAYKPW